MQKSKLKVKILNYLIVGALVFIIATPVFAAQMIVDSKNREIKLNERFKVEIFLDSQGESVNAVEGRIFFPSDLLKLEKISDGGAIISVWVEKPRMDSAGQIIFSGIVPGGFNRESGLILTLIFQTKKAGIGTIELGNMRAVKNDGRATLAEISLKNFEFKTNEAALSANGQWPMANSEELAANGNLSERADAATPRRAIPHEIAEQFFNGDKNPPEIFLPQIAKDPNVFNSKYFLVFAAQDKESGIDRYEVKEGDKSFVIAQSPYLLENQRLTDVVVVKAVDKNGNERMVAAPTLPKKRVPRFFIVFLSIIGALAPAYLKRKRLKNLVFRIEN